IVMDESSLTGAFDTEKISNLAREIGARVVFQGDTKQYGSVAAGRAFEQAKNSGMKVSVLQETRRFDKAT
ncbi:AAA family ATPase, partial [Escherichia coli]|uniref:AAA family ATPase n=1 Tax=Escherichia coli TaxID=562 RepID=UPI00256F3C70